MRNMKNGGWASQQTGRPTDATIRSLRLSYFRKIEEIGLSCIPSRSIWEESCFRIILARALLEDHTITRITRATDDSGKELSSIYIGGCR